MEMHSFVAQVLNPIAQVQFIHTAVAG